MAITFTQQRKEQKKLIWIFIIMVFLILFIWAQKFFKRNIFEGIKTSAFESKKIKIDFQVLEKPILKEFRSFEKIKPFEGTPGRENPFLPY